MKRARLAQETMANLRATWDSFGSQLPPINSLPEHLVTPLQDHEKIPISEESFDQLLRSDRVLSDRNCSETDLRRIFRIHKTDRIGPHQTFLYVFGLDTPGPNCNKNAYIHLWDSLIRNIMARMIRTARTESAVSKPTQQSAMNTENPKAELIETLNGWSYGAVPYIFGYYAKGTSVTYVAMTKDERKKDAEIHDLCELDFNKMVDRITNIIILIRMAPLLRRLSVLVGSREFGEYVNNQWSVRFFEVVLAKTEYALDKVIIIVLQVIAP
ncbi:hypothetical protein BD410DRAFT_832284 [Rickenella mellea]|uniref:Uncharacterized protein n=1 Tax=Rickenella mellea TaxID=50990 RepID=A0A4Y7PLV5_9AGAM|nr:hypothetical protein BD410DRAFT_832284 [Rickenella mellea]